MKKYYLILAAVAGLFASCSNEVLVDSEQALGGDSTPKTIGFSTYSARATRGDATVKTNLEYYHNTFAVYGTKQAKADATDIQYVFGGDATTTTGTKDGVTCTYQTTPDAILGDWKYDLPRYWDRQATYDFVAYAPVAAANPLRYSYAAAKAQVGDTGNDFVTTATYTLTGTNLQATATEAEIVKGFTVEKGKDLDLMTSAVNPQDGASHDADVNLIFRHILAKLNITFAKAAVLDGATVTITSVEVTGLDDSGDYVESSYNATATPAVSGWTSSSVDAAYKLAYSGSQVLNASTGKAYFFIESLVMPQSVKTTAKLVVTYTIQTGTYAENFTYTIDDLSTVFTSFLDRCNYFLRFTIKPDVITFDATVTPWVDETAVNKVIG